MSKVKEDKSTFAGCCQTSPNTTPENSISEDSIELDDTAANNNTMFHTHQFEDTKSGGIDSSNLCFGNMDKNFPKRKLIDVEFQNIKYSVGKFSFRERKFGKFNFN